MKLSARGSGHLGPAPPRHTLSKNNRGRWAAERKTHVLELKECVHSILAIPPRKLHTPMYTRVTLYTGLQCKAPWRQRTLGEGILCHSLLVLRAAWRCPSLLSADSSLVPGHRSHSSPPGWGHLLTTDPCSSSSPSPIVYGPAFWSHQDHQTLHASVSLRPSHHPVCSSSAQLRDSSQHLDCSSVNSLAFLPSASRPSSPLPPKILAPQF